MKTQQTTLIPLDPKIEARIGLSIETLAEFCRKWGIDSMALFGSVLREDFRPDSDLDFLVTFSSDTRQGLLKQVKIKHDLESFVSRKVDIIVRQSVEESDNWIRRREILTTERVIYEQR